MPSVSGCVKHAKSYVVEKQIKQRWKHFFSLCFHRCHAVATKSDAPSHRVLGFMQVLYAKLNYTVRAKDKFYVSNHKAVTR